MRILLLSVTNELRRVLLNSRFTDCKFAYIFWGNESLWNCWVFYLVWKLGNIKFFLRIGFSPYEKHVSKERRSFQKILESFCNFQWETILWAEYNILSASLSIICIRNYSEFKAGSVCKKCNEWSTYLEYAKQFKLDLIITLNLRFSNVYAVSATNHLNIWKSCKIIHMPIESKYISF